MTSNTTIKRAYADTEYGQIHYRQAGSGDPLVLMHYCPSNGRQYQHTLAQFAERGYAAFAPDLAGYGDSDKPDRQWSIEDFAVNLGEFLDFLHLDSVLLVGGHTSAAISTEFAVENPQRVRRLALDGSPAWDATRRAEMTGTYVPPLKLSPEGDHMMWAWKRSYRRPEMPLERVFASAVDLLKAGFTYHTGYEAVFAYDMEARLREINVPTLALTADEDPLFVEHQKVMRLVPGVKEHTFEGRGPLSDPDRATEFVEAIDAFMRSSG